MTVSLFVRFWNIPAGSVQHEMCSRFAHLQDICKVAFQNWNLALANFRWQPLQLPQHTAAQYRQPLSRTNVAVPCHEKRCQLCVSLLDPVVSVQALPGFFTECWGLLCSKASWTWNLLRGWTHMFSEQIAWVSMFARLRQCHSISSCLKPRKPGISSFKLPRLPASRNRKGQITDAESITTSNSPIPLEPNLPDLQKQKHALMADTGDALPAWSPLFFFVLFYPLKAVLAWLPSFPSVHLKYFGIVDCRHEIRKFSAFLKHYAALEEILFSARDWR